MSTDNDPGLIANAGTFISNILVDPVARQMPWANENRGDFRLDDAHKLAIEYESVIDSKDREAIEDRITLAREMKLGLETKWGFSRFLHAREYRRAATHALKFAEAVSDRVLTPGRLSAESYFQAGYRAGGEASGAPCQFRFGISDPPYVPTIDPTFVRVTGIAQALWRCYLSCNDAFPIPSKRGEWAAVVWCEASVRAGTYPGSLFQAEQFTVSSVDFLTEIRMKIRPVVENLYDFDANKAAGNLRYNAARARQLLVKMAFTYRECNPGGGIQHQYRHPIIQEVINSLWFKNNGDGGMTFQEHFSPMPIPAMALVLTVAQCCIGEWADGTLKESSWDEEHYKVVYRSHIESLTELHNSESSDLLEKIRSDLLEMPGTVRIRQIPPTPGMLHRKRNFQHILTSKYQESMSRANVISEDGPVS